MKAAAWLFLLAVFSLPAEGQDQQPQSGVFFQIPEEEYDALVDLYNSTGGDFWSTNSGWLDQDAAFWSGVDVEGVQYDTNGDVAVEGNVQQLDLYGNGLSGHLPASLGNFSQLLLLELGDNQIGGGIPESILNLSQLQVLGLSENQLEGGIPNLSAGLSQLTYLDLSSNLLAGTIPSFADMPDLQTIDLSINHLTGMIPDLSGLASLTYFGLETNWLSILGGSVKGNSSLAAVAAMTKAGKNVPYLPQGIGVDISSATPALSWFGNIWRLGFNYVIVEGWDGNFDGKGGVRFNARQNLNYARRAGLQTAGYCFLNFNSGVDGGEQVRNALIAFGSEAKYLGFLAVDVEIKGETVFSPSADVAAIQRAVKQVQDLGLQPVIYSLKSGWGLITGSDVSDFHQIPLWGASATDGNDLNNPPLGNIHNTFGGWTQRVGKQYLQDDPPDNKVYLNGVEVDYDVFDRSAFTLSNPNYRPQAVISADATAGVCAFTWADSTFNLESAPTLSGPWTPVPGATSPYVVPVGQSAPQCYYRAR